VWIPPADFNRSATQQYSADYVAAVRALATVTVAPSSDAPVTPPRSSTSATAPGADGRGVRRGRRVERTPQWDAVLRGLASRGEASDGGSGGGGGRASATEQRLLGLLTDSDAWWSKPRGTDKPQAATGSRNGQRLAWRASTGQSIKVADVAPTPKATRSRRAPSQ
jgi:hypothetical protein